MKTPKKYMIERTLPTGHKVYYGGLAINQMSNRVTPMFYEKDEREAFRYEYISEAMGKLQMLKDNFGFLNIELKLIELPENEWISDEEEKA